MNEKAKRPRGRPKSVDRQKAIDIALQHYWQEGLYAVSFNEICRLVGISKPALYREFGGEDGLMAATLRSYREQRVLPLLKGLAQDRPMEEMIEGTVQALTAADGTPAGCLFTRMRLAGPRLGPLTRAGVEQLGAEQRTAFEDWYRRALARGDANPNLEPEAAARYFDTQVATMLVQMAEGVEPEWVREQGRLALGVLVIGSHGSGTSAARETP